MTISEIDQKLEELRERICYLTYDRIHEDISSYQRAGDLIERERLEKEYSDLEEMRVELSRDECEDDSDESDFGED